MDIRRYNKGDIKSLVKLYSNHEVIDNLKDDVFIDRHMTINDAVRQLIYNRSYYMLGSNPDNISVTYVPLSGVNYSLHIVLHPDYRGVNSVKECVQTAGFMFRYTPCKSIIAFAHDRQSQVVACMAGMRRIGKTRGSFLFNSEYLDEVIYQGTERDYNKWVLQH